MTPEDLINLIKSYVSKLGVIIVGGNLCKEIKWYGRVGFDPIAIFEPLPDVFKALESRVGHWPNTKLFNCAISDFNDKAKFYVASNSVSSSLMKPKEVMKHQRVTIEDEIEVDVTTLDEAITEEKHKYATLIIDTEGSELNVLKGATKMLKIVEFVCVELNFDENYEGCAKHEEVTKYLESKGFKKIHEKFGDKTKSYGDALFVKD